VSAAGTSRAALIFLTASFVLAVGAILLGLSMTPSPWRQRAIDQDKRKISELIALANAILAYERANGNLPASLQKLPEAAALRRADPTTGTEYEYVLSNAQAFQLCAAFAAISEEAMPSPPEASAWRHQAGRHCFSVSAPQGRP
jgi:hypothetical protein